MTCFWTFIDNRLLIGYFNEVGYELKILEYGANKTYILAQGMLWLSPFEGQDHFRHMKAPKPASKRSLCLLFSATIVAWVWHTLPFGDVNVHSMHARTQMT